MSRVLLIIVCFFAFMSCNDKKNVGGEEPIPPTLDKSDSIFRQLHYLDIDAMNGYMRTRSANVLSKISGEIIFDTINPTRERVVVVEQEMGGTKALLFYAFMQNDSLEEIYTRMRLTDLSGLKTLDKIRYTKNLSDKIFACLNSHSYYRYTHGDFWYDPVSSSISTLSQEQEYIYNKKRSLFWKDMDKWISGNVEYSSDFTFMEYCGVNNDYLEFEDGNHAVQINQCSDEYKLSSSRSVLWFDITRIAYLETTEEYDMQRCSLDTIKNVVMDKYNDRIY